MQLADRYGLTGSSAMARRKAGLPPMTGLGTDDNVNAAPSQVKDDRWKILLLLLLASSGPYGPLLACSGYPGQDASFYNNPMVMICAIVNALTLLQTILCKIEQIGATINVLI